ncbi:hypothetical protein [Spirosoma gilvum]
MKLFFVRLTLFFLLTPWTVYAQADSAFYRPFVRDYSTIGIGFRGGVNYSISTIVATEVGSPSPIPFIAGIVPQYGYYLGGSIYKNFSTKLFSLRLDATLQIKGFGSEYNGQIIVKAKYYYLGLAPLVGFHLTPKLSVFTGPEANLQLLRKDTYPFTSGYPLEIGTILRLSYAFGQFRAEAGYFRAFTPMDQSTAFRFPGSSAKNNFYNQNIQFGLLFDLR